MDRADILKCSKLLSMISRKSQRLYGAILTRSEIHQKGKAQKSRNKKGQWKNHNRNRIWRGGTANSHPNKKLHIWDHPISKLYNADCVRFPIRSRSGNEYIMIAYNFDSNTILQAQFFNRKEKHSIRAYNSIMQRLAEKGHQVDVQILDNEVST